MSQVTARPAHRAGHHAPALKQLALAVRILTSGAVLAAPVLHAPAFAQSPAADETRPYAIPAGPLAPALSRFVGESGVLMTGAGALAQGKTSPGLQGHYTPAAGLSALLSGTGLQAVRGNGGEYTLRSVGDSAGYMLPATVVQADAERSATTDGTGSYTSRQASTATGLGLSLRETPQSVSVITRQRMDDQGLTQLTDVIAYTPGLTVSQSGNAGSDTSPIYARGFQVETYMLDGVRQVDSNYSSIFQTYDMEMFDRVEVVRGATGLMNGFGTPSAAINLVRKRPTEEFRASAKVELGSWNYRRITGDIGGPLNEAGTLRGRIVAVAQENDSYIDRLHEKKQAIFGTLEADIAPGTLVRGGLSTQNHKASGHARSGLPAYFSDGTRTSWSRSASAAPSWSYSDRSTSNVFAAIEHRLAGDWLLKATASRTITDYDELVGYAANGYPNQSTGAGLGLWATRWAAKPKQDALDLQAAGTFELFGRRHDLAAGALLSRTHYTGPSYTNWTFPGWSSSIANIYSWDGNTPAAPPNPAIGTFGNDERLNSVYASARLRPTDTLSVILGGRVSDWQRRQSTYRTATGASTYSVRRETGEFTPYAGITYDFSASWSAYASYTNIFKPQNNRLQNGDYLEPQVGDSYELGVKGAFFGDRMNIGAAVYKAKQDNLAVSIPGVFAPDGSQAYQSVSGTSTRGFEVEASGQVRPGWQLSAGFSRNMTEDRNGAPLLTNVPRNSATFYTSYRIAALGRGLTVGGGLRWQNEIYTDNLGPLRARFVQPSYAVVDLMARYPITDKVTAAVNVSNLFDKSYYMSTGASYYGAPRSVRASLNVAF